jgi:hypothetical protein
VRRRIAGYFNQTTARQLAASNHAEAS